MSINLPLLMRQLSSLPELHISGLVTTVRDEGQTNGSCDSMTTIVSNLPLIYSYLVQITLPSLTFLFLIFWKNNKSIHAIQLDI